MAMRAYGYGVRVYREHEEPEEVGDQLVLRTRYWNNLVEMEREDRGADTERSRALAGGRGIVGAGRR